MKRIGIVATQVAMLRALEVKTQLLLKEPDFEVKLETLQLTKDPTPRIELGNLKIELFNAAARLFERGYGVVGFADEAVPSFFSGTCHRMPSSPSESERLVGIVLCRRTYRRLKGRPCFKGL